MSQTLFDSLQVKDIVSDKWYPERGWGIILKKYKTTIHIDWGYGRDDIFRIYDKQHVNHFLIRNQSGKKSSIRKKNR